MKRLSSILIAGWLLVGLLEPPNNPGPAGIQIREVIGGPYVTLRACQAAASWWIQNDTPVDPSKLSAFDRDTVRVDPRPEAAIFCEGTKESR